MAWKTLERVWRRAILGAGRRPFRGTVACRAEDLLRLSPGARILLVRMERIGDVLVSVPVLRALRTRYPQARIDLLLSRANLAVGDAVAPFVNIVWCYQKTLGSALGLLRSLRRVRYDVVVDLVDNPSATAQLVVRWCGAPAAVGVFHSESSRYTHAVPLLDRSTVHPVERLAQLLLPFGIDPREQSLDLQYPLDQDAIATARRILGPRRRPIRLGVNLSGRDADNYWGRQNYIALINHVTRDDQPVAVSVCGAPGDAAEVRAVADATGAQAVPPQSSLHQFAAILHEFDMLLTPDTAAVHLAAAWKLPTVALYRADPASAPWLPYHSPHRAVAHPAGIPAIGVEEVIAAVEELIRSTSQSPSPRGGSATRP